MKKILTAVAMALLLLGCVKQEDDHSGILEKLAELENRVSALEGSIASIQSAIGDGVFAQKVEPYVDTETGKTIGVTVTYTSGKVVYFEISPKAGYAGPVLSVITNGAGQLVWAVDGVAIKDNKGNEVPVNKTPVFTIDDDGNLLVSIDGGDPVVVGKIQNEGATLVDGIFKDIRVEQDKVVLVLSDDSVVNIPFATAFKLNIEKTEYVLDGKSGTITIPYTVSGKTANTVVGVAGYDPYYFYVEVTEENILITPLQIDSEAVFLIYADSGVGLTSMVSVSVSQESAFVIDPKPEGIDVDYVVEAEGGNLEMHVVSNVEIDVIPSELTTWITIVETKSKTYTITAKVEENKTVEDRIGQIGIYKKGTTENPLQRIDIFQKAGEPEPVETINLSKNGAANSYIVTKAGEYKLWTVKGNSGESVGTVAKAEILWETENTATAPEANSIIASVSYAKDYITFATPKTLKPGNALIAAKDADGKILWSWHIWIPKTVPTSATYGLSSSIEMLDRNIGALDAPKKDSEDGQNAGLFYQWGRKDPLRAISSIAEGTMAKTVPADVWTESSTQLTAANMHETPCVFIKGSEDWISESNATLWADAKTITDPCPPGYKVPKRGETTLFDYITPDESYKGWSIDDTKNYFTIGKEESSYAVFPFGHYSRSGSYDLKGDGAAWFWTATNKGESEMTLARTMVLKVSDAKIDCSGQKKANGAYVRCVVDNGTPILPPEDVDTVVDLSKDGTANCYIIPATTTAGAQYEFKAVKGNSNESVGTVAKAEVFWETWGTADEPKANSVVAEASYEDGYVVITMPETLHTGNAVIAVKDASDVILWSWHIWVPADEVKTLDGAVMGGTILDRNLGALIAPEAWASADAVKVEAFGLYYQWGRKDPFPGPKDLTDGPSKTPLVGAQFTKEERKVGEAELVTIEWAIQHPNYYPFSSKWNEEKQRWDKGSCDWLKESQDDLWDNEGKKTIYDPCPVGYKVPAYNTDLAFWKKSVTDWTFDKANFYFKAPNSNVAFPLSGYIDDGGGSIVLQGRVFYWSSKTYSDHIRANGADIRTDKSDVYYSEKTYKARGASVRCVAEDNLK